jgi:hypothetical protein
MVFTIMGRVCPWELAYYLPRLKLKRALVRFYERSAALGRGLAWLDDHVGDWPGMRAAGDHFLMILRKR